jgi:hypothetical protein
LACIFADVAGNQFAIEKFIELEQVSGQVIVQIKLSIRASMISWALTRAIPASPGFCSAMAAGPGGPGEWHRRTASGSGHPDWRSRLLLTILVVAFVSIHVRGSFSQVNCWASQLL